MEHDSLIGEAVRGAKWTGASIAYATFLQFLTTAILARLLSPSDFGLLGMMFVATGLIGRVADAGVSNAIIYHQDATRDELSSLYWLNLLSGIGVFVVILMACPLVVAFFKEPRLSTYLPWIGINFLILPIGQQFGILLRKNLHFDTMTKIGVISQTVSCASSIAMALFGFGIWSLVFRSMIHSLVQALALLYVGIRCEWLPRFYFSLRSIRRYVGFGLFQMGERFVNYLSENVDYLIIGRLLGAEALGFYTLGYSLMKSPLSKINPIITKVAFPAFAKIQYDDKRLRNSYLKMMTYISTCSFPITAGLFVLAPSFIPVIYGPQWGPAVPILQILCLVGAIYSLGNPISSLLLAKGRADVGFYFNVLKCLVMSTANMIGAKWGVIGVAWSSLIAIVLIMWPGDFYLRWYLVRMKVAEYFRSVKAPAATSGLMIILLWSIGFLWGQMNSISSLIFQIAIGFSFYFLSTFIIAKPFCLELKNLIFGKR